MGVRAKLIVGGLVLSLAACGSTAQNVKSLGAIPAIDTTDLTIPPVSVPDITVPTITVPSTTVPSITSTGGSTAPFTIPASSVTTVPVTTGDTTAVTVASPATVAPPLTDAPPAGATQTISGGGISMQIPSDWKASDAGSTIVTIPVSLGGNAPILQFSSPGNDSITVSTVVGQISLYKTIFASQPSLTAEDVTIDGREALHISSSADTGLAIDFLFVQGAPNKVFLVTFLGLSDGVKAVETAIFQSIKISS